MIIKVFGPGCATCRAAEQIVLEAVASSGMNVAVEKVTDLREMMAAGVLSTPAISINGTVLCSGRVPSKHEVVVWLMSAASRQER